MGQNILCFLSYLELIVLGKTRLHEDNQAALRRGPHGEQLRLPAYGPVGRDFRWLQLQLIAWLQLHGRSWTKSTQLRGFWIPDSQRLCEKINVYYYLNSLSSWINGYSSINNTDFILFPEDSCFMLLVTFLSDSQWGQYLRTSVIYSCLGLILCVNLTGPWGAQISG